MANPAGSAPTLVATTTVPTPKSRQPAAASTPAGTRPASQRSFTQFSEIQIANVSPVTAYDAVVRLRPIALYPPGGPSFEPSVYLDGLRLGGVEQLSRISAIDLIGVEFLTPIEAAAKFGPSGRNGGAILLTTRIGRRTKPY